MRVGRLDNAPVSETGLGWCDSNTRSNMQNQFNVGDKVKVLKRDETPSGHTLWNTLHRGVVIRAGTRFVAVFNSRPDSGDTTPEYAESFAISSKYIKVEAI